ncbi:MAG: hypothetical protein AB1757_24265 [Acidobacteriota bacterium]
MFKYSYGLEKLTQVMRILIMDLPLSERLIDSLPYFTLISNPLGGPHIPFELEEEYDRLHDLLLHIKNHQPTDDEIQHCAQRIFDLYLQVETACTLDKKIKAEL